MKDLVIRFAKDIDSESISNLIFDIWLNEYGFEVGKNDAIDLLDIDAHYDGKTGLFLVALEASEMVGTIACSQLSGNNWVLKRMFVKKAYRRKGIAQRLYNELVCRLKSLVKKRNIILYLSTKEKDALSAKAFYLRNGFSSIEKSKLPNNFPYFYKDDLFMQRTLSEGVGV